MTTPLLGTTGVKADTALGGHGVAREDKAELFVAAVSSFSGDKSHESGAGRSARVIELTREIALEDPRWVMRFDRWLRDEANIRTLTIEVACAFVKARLDAGVPDEAHPGTPGMNRTVINVACARADEPSLLIEYWLEHYGRKIPKPVKRGAGDAAVRLWNEYTALKYDTSSLNVRFADLLELCHPKPKDDAQGALFEWLLNRRHGVKESPEIFEKLPMVTASTHVRSLMDSEESRALLRENLLEEPASLKDAGMTWENLAGLGPMDARAWEAVIPQMGYMALLRNLRNFDSAKISAGSVEHVKRRLGDETAVRKSRVFPFRFYSAYKAAGSRWQGVLETALGHSLSNVPELSGRTLIMVDCSGSMYGYVSGRSDLTYAEQAALFGTALAQQCEDATLVKYGTTSALVTPRAGVLSTMSQFGSMGGTDTAGTAQEWLRRSGPFDRVVILTDEQDGWYGGPSVGKVVPNDVMLYTWNVAGYNAAHAEASPTRHTFAGLTDQSFKMIPLIEAGLTYDWPF